MLLAQDGHQAGTRIHAGIESGLIKGAVISTGFRDSSKLPTFVTELQKVGSSPLVLFDNEFYVNSIQGADKFGQLETYPYYCHPLTKKDLVSPMRMQELIKKVLDFQIESGLSSVTTPTVIIESFNSNSESTSLSLCFGSIEYLQTTSFKGNTYCSLVISEQALSNTDSLPDFLTTITSVTGIKGFYVVFDKTASATPHWSNPATLAASMYLTDVLRQNNFDVIIGYSDVTGILHLATGAQAIATGWWENTTNFSQNKFVKRDGGKRRKKYFSENLMGSIYIDTVVNRALALGLLDTIMPTTAYDQELAKNPLETAWPDQTAIFHKWAAIGNLINQCSSDGKVDIVKTEVAIDSALNTHDLLVGKGVSFDNGMDSSRIRTMKQAIALYRAGVV